MALRASRRVIPFTRVSSVWTNLACAAAPAEDALAPRPLIASTIVRQNSSYCEGKARVYSADGYMLGRHSCYPSAFRGSPFRGSPFVRGFAASASAASDSQESLVIENPETLAETLANSMGSSNGVSEVAAIADQSAFPVAILQYTIDAFHVYGHMPWYATPRDSYL